MTIERVSKKDDRFWAWNLFLTAFLMIALYCLINSSALMKLFFSSTGLLTQGASKKSSLSSLIFLLLTCGLDFLWGYGIVFSISFVFKRTKEQLKTGLLIALGFELLLFLLKVFVFTKGAMSPSIYLSVLLGNASALFIVLLHERILI